MGMVGAGHNQHAAGCTNQNSELKLATARTAPVMAAAAQMHEVQPELINNCLLKCINKGPPQLLPAALLMRQGQRDAVTKTSPFCDCVSAVF